MSKLDDYKQKITNFIEQDKYNDLTIYLKEESNLPGKMLNLTLIQAFGDVFESIEINNQRWDYLNELYQVTFDGNDENTMVALAALEAFGAIFYHVSDNQQQSLKTMLREAMNDNRWRVREIVTESYTRIAVDYEMLIKLFDEVMLDSTLLEKRAVLASVAHPEILMTKTQQKYSLNICKTIFNDFLLIEKTKENKDEYEALSKGLKFAPSVVVASDPEEGFAMFEHYINLQHKQLNQCIKSNLKKGRLVNKFPEEVERLLELI